MSEGECLVAREILASRESHEDSLTDKLHGLSIDERKDKSTHNIQPSDYVTLQSIRSSALARKTNTTSKIGRGGQALFSDLLNREDVVATEAAEKDKDEETKEKSEVKKEEAKEGTEKKEEKNDDKKDEKKEEDKKEEKEEEKKDNEGADGELIDRGPMRNPPRQTIAAHPYAANHGRVNYGAAAQTNVEDYSAYSGYGMGYECGVPSWQDSPDTSSYISSSSTPDTVNSVDYASSISPGNSPFADNMTSSELNRLLGVGEELPPTLADFILTFSRNYPTSRDNEIYCHRPASVSESAHGLEDSPLSAGSAPHCSPGAPHAGYTGRASPPGSTLTSIQQDRPARLRLRAEIPENRLDPALFWVCKCIQVAPGALLYQDPDQDSLLHIVMHHNDIAKVYAIVEQQLKLDYPADRKPFDLKNRFHETPLLIAVEKKNLMVMQYLLEAGANPNSQPLRGQRDAVLHYAATRGMTEFVKILVADTHTHIDLRNGLGLTALHCAVRHHGVLDEETQKPIDNLEIIKLLLEAGADPSLASSSDGKTIIHFAAEKCDAAIIELLRKQLADDVLTELVNRADFNHEVPMDVLQIYKDKIDEQAHSTMFFAMLTCGAAVGKA